MAVAGNAERGTDAAGSAFIARFFGWGMLALTAAFLVNNVLTFWLGWPGVAPFFGWESTGEIGLQSGIQAAFYAVGLGVAFFYARARSDEAIRDDGHAATALNRFLIRAAFWAVLFIGIADTVVSFLRVEGLLGDYFSPEWASGLNKSDFRGLYIHVPCIVAGIFVALILRHSLGFIWLALLVVLAELLIVLSRFVFSYEQAFMADLVRFWYAALFLFASAYTLLEDGHVRVDVVYAGMTRRGKAFVNAWGAILLGMTLCWTILLVGMWSSAAIINSPILVWETTQTGFGMYVKYLMAGFLAIFAVSMMIQFVASFFDAQADRRGESGHREHEEIMH